MSDSKIFDLYLASNKQNQDPGSSIEYLAQTYGEDIFQRLLNSLLSTYFSPKEATDFWRAAMQNYNQDCTRMNWRSVVLDYLLARTELLKNPRIIDADELKQLQTEAVTDGLTNLYNQSHFKQRLATVIREHKATPDAVFSLIILDLDRFKQFNDRCGHLRGDRALEKIGKLICTKLPKDAMAARYGGEEFAIILPNTNLEAAVEIAEAIRCKVAETEFDGEERLDSGKLTISGGVASFPELGVDSDSLISYADSKLYEAKVTRNSICPLPNNTRRVIRHNYRSIVEIFNTKTGDFKNSLSADISPTGILLKSCTPAVIGSKLKLRFPYPFWPSDHYTNAEVRHIRRNGRRGAFMVGLQFNQPQDDFLAEVIPMQPLAAESR
jgi:diguanylate cyclase (GGDEF)-like protein